MRTNVDFSDTRNGVTVRIDKDGSVTVAPAYPGLATPAAIRLNAEDWQWIAALRTEALEAFAKVEKALSQ